MGCDIHGFAEVKRNNKWEKVGDVFKYPYYDEKDEIDKYNKPLTDSFYSGRNYDLFAILADVRNGYGFAGVKTGEGFNPISEPKGLPEDISNDVLMAEACVIGDKEDEYDLETLKGWVKRGYSKWIVENESCTNPDAHSASWLTVKELLDYNWNQVTMHRGVITLEQYKKLKDVGGCPDNWSGGISGHNIVTIDEDEADEIILEEIEGLVRKKFIGKEIYVNYHWTSTYADSAKYFIDETMPVLKGLDENPENVRIVFWFDN